MRNMNGHSKSKLKYRKRGKEQESSQLAEPVIAQECKEKAFKSEEDVGSTQETASEAAMGVQGPDLKSDEELTLLMQVHDLGHVLNDTEYNTKFRAH